jgi:hypothetical protein
MNYQVVAFTMAEVRQGALAWQRQLTGRVRENPDLKIYSPSPFDLDERRRMKDRFGGDIVYFFNETACQAAEQLGLEIAFAATISEEEMPRRRTLVVGIPERSPLNRN